MRLLRLISIVLIYEGMTLSLFSQQETDKDKNEIIEKRIELLAEQTESEELDYTTLLDELSYYFDHPINLNNANKEELRGLYLLNEIQIKSLLDHLKKNGKLITIYELQSVANFDVETIQQIMPFVKVGSPEEKPHISLREMRNNGSNEVFFRYIRMLETMEGYTPVEDSLLVANPNKRYLGSPDRLYLRYRYRFDTHVSWGFTAEKDAGEEFFNDTQKNGFDYYSAHLYLSKIGHLKQLAIGDYQLQIGQGLTFWSGLAFGKSSDVMSIKKNPAMIKPYTSVDENRFMRGVASTIKTGDFLWTAFVSSKNIDANINTDSSLTASDFSFTSFQTSGYHRTPAELADKHAIGELIYGGRIGWEKGSLNIGATAIQSNLDATFQKNIQLYNQFEFNSNHLLTTGIDYSYVLHNINLYGEASRSDNGGMAFVNGALIALDPDFSIALLHRSYDRDFQSLNSNGFAESSKTINEQGLYIGAEASPFNHITFKAYIDKFKFPWLKYQVNAPSDGLDYIIQTSWKPMRKLQAYARFRQKIKTRNSSIDSLAIEFPEITNLKSLRLNLNCKLNDDYRIKSRVEVKEYTKGSDEPEYGFLIFQDIFYKPIDKPWSFAFRYALFQTDTYDARIYAYENDIPYYYSIPSYYFRGFRTYLILNYTILRNVDVWIRAARTIYSNQESIGSGLNQIAANHKTEVKLQLRLRF